MFHVRHLSGPHFGPIDLQLAPRELLCLYGPSGVGKSQLLRALADLEPHEGEVQLADVPQQAVRPTEWRRQVAYLPAESGWWAPRVVQHFAQPPGIEALATLGLTPDILEREVDGLSTGELQRLGLLRMLDQRPRVLLLDEPSANLDPESALLMEARVLRYLDEARAAAIWVSHDPLQRERIADRSIELKAREAA